MYIFIYVYICIYIHLYTHIFSHTQTYTDIFRTHTHKDETQYASRLNTICICTCVIVLYDVQSVMHIDSHVTNDLFTKIISQDMNFAKYIPGCI